MTALLGFGGMVELTIGDVTKPVGELRSYSIVLDRDRLATTTQADEDVTATAGRRSASGTFELWTRFYESDCWSTYQIVQHLLNTTDDDVICAARFRVQQTGESDNCEDFGDAVWLEADIIPDFRLNLNPGNGVESSVNWTSTGAVRLVREG
jgi:hypothetical protein